MKRLVMALVAVATLAGPMVVASDAAAQSYRSNDRYDRSDRYNRYDRNDRRDYRGDDRRRYDNNSRYYNNNRWDNRRYNGYYLGNRWYYGAPSVSYYSRRDYRPAYRAWTRGSYLPRSYWGYGVSDYRRYHLRQPPRGYHWVRAGNDYVLAAIATGLIAEVILNGGF
jgi:Ni/Co efflux regulator RcnB